VKVGVDFITGTKGLFSDHTLIIVDENSSLEYVETHSTGPGKHSALRNDYAEIYLEQGSQLDFHCLKNWSRNVTDVSFFTAFAGRDAAINWYFAKLGGKFSRTKVDTFFLGEGSSSRCNGIIYGGKDQVFDMTTNSHHLVPHTTCDVLVKGAFKDNCKSVYRGMIRIDKKAKYTSSYLSNHSLLLGEEARSNTIPSLMIETDEVKASHGATLGKINKDQMFYLMSRGMDYKTAEKLLIEAFLAQVVDSFHSKEFSGKVLRWLK
jgi:FeS assembly protein SufD